MAKRVVKDETSKVEPYLLTDEDIPAAVKSLENDYYKHLEDKAARRAKKDGVEQ